MAKRIKDKLPTFVQRGPKFNYPWDEWIDGKTRWVLVQGEDFNCSIRSMQNYIKKITKQKGYNYSIRETVEPTGLYLEPRKTKKTNGVADAGQKLEGSREKSS